MMNLNFLGKGAAFYPPYGNTSAYFISNRELFLLDCGESVFERLYQKVDFSQIDRAFVLITHLHADHVGSLGSLLSYCAMILGKPVCVVHPQRTLVQLLDLQGSAASFYKYHAQLPANAAGVAAEAVEVHHSDAIACYGYIVRDADECIYYSGDSAGLPQSVTEQFLAGAIQRIYQDTTLSPSDHHGYCGRMEEAIPFEKRKDIYCMHLDNPCEVALIKRGFSIAPVIVE